MQEGAVASTTLWGEGLEASSQGWHENGEFKLTP